MSSVRGFTLSVSLSVIILMLPFVFSLLIDLLFSLTTLKTDLVQYVLPMYVLALQLLFFSLGLMGYIIDLVANFFVDMLNPLMPFTIPYLDLQGLITFISEQSNVMLLSFVSLISALKAGSNSTNSK